MQIFPYILFSEFFFYTIHLWKREAIELNELKSKQVEVLYFFPLFL